MFSSSDLYLARQRHYNDKEPICESERTDLRYVITIGKRSASTKRHSRLITESTRVYLSTNDDFKREFSPFFVRHWMRSDLQLSTFARKFSHARECLIASVPQSAAIFVEKYTDEKLKRFARIWRALPIGSGDFIHLSVYQTKKKK